MPVESPQGRRDVLLKRVCGVEQDGGFFIGHVCV